VLDPEPLSLEDPESELLEPPSLELLEPESLDEDESTVSGPLELSVAGVGPELPELDESEPEELSLLSPTSGPGSPPHDETPTIETTNHELPFFNHTIAQSSHGKPASASDRFEEPSMIAMPTRACHRPTSGGRSW